MGLLHMCWLSYLTVASWASLCLRFICSLCQGTSIDWANYISSLLHSVAGRGTCMEANGNQMELNSYTCVNPSLTPMSKQPIEFLWRDIENGAGERGNRNRKLYILGWPNHPNHWKSNTETEKVAFRNTNCDTKFVCTHPLLPHCL